MTAQALFSTDELKAQAPAEPKHSQAETRKAEKAKAVLAKAAARLQDVIGTIRMGETTHYVSCADWSMHDLLFHVLRQTGPAAVHLTTWSISENPMRQLIKRAGDGSMTKLAALFDWRIKVRTPAVYELARFALADVRLANCHAKVTIVQNQEWGVAIVGSANMTHNPRIEAGVITADRDIAEFHRTWIQAEVDGADPFDTETEGA